MGELLATLFAIGGVLVIFILLSLLFIKLGWAMFMVPVFGLPDITWMQALGFSFLASAFKSPSTNKKN